MECGTKPNQQTPNLLSLPLEVRLQIYRWLHLMSPVNHPSLIPWYPSPVYSLYLCRIVRHSDDQGLSPSPSPSPKDAPSTMLSPERPLSGLPTSLLQANSQMYYEARRIPFETNEFVFVNWFASGMWAARAFTRALKAWQRDLMRYVRLEVQARDFVGPGLAEWHALCDHWAPGVRGLRMKIVIGNGLFGGVPSAEEDKRAREVVAVFQQEANRWVSGGLDKLRGLQRLEMELTTLYMRAEEKLQWCSGLEEVLRERGLKVTVVCTEGVQEKKPTRRVVIEDDTRIVL